MKSFCVPLDKVDRRIDPHYYKPEYLALDAELRQSGKTTLKVDDIATVICGPFGSAVTVKDYLNSGVPLIRIDDIDDDHMLSFKNTVYISEGLASKLKSYRVKEGDLIISQRGTLGLSATIPSSFNGSVISANFIAVKNIEQISADFLKLFLNTKCGNMQLVRRTSGQVQTKITTDDIKSLLVVIPSPAIQDKAIQILRSAYDLKKQKEQDAKELLSSMDSYIFDALNIKPPDTKRIRCYSTESSKVGNRFDPPAHHPIRTSTIERIQQSSQDKLPLKEIVTFRKDLVSSESKTIRYVGLENIESGTGRFIPSAENKEAFGTALRFQKGDILFPKLRPYLNKVYLAQFDGVCSTEFHVLAPKLCDMLYLSAFLRSRLVTNQTSYLMTGNTLPRLQSEDVETLLIPIPSSKTQTTVAKEYESRLAESEKLKAEAREVVEQAKKTVEDMILGMTRRV